MSKKIYTKEFLTQAVEGCNSLTEIGERIGKLRRVKPISKQRVQNIISLNGFKLEKNYRLVKRV